MLNYQSVNPMKSPKIPLNHHKIPLNRWNVPVPNNGAVPVPPGRWNFCRRGGVQELDPHLQGASEEGMVHL